MAKASRRNQSGTKTLTNETVVKTTTDKGAAGAVVTDPVKEPELVDHVVTDADMKANPELVDLGVTEGETIQLPMQPNAEDGEMLQEGELPEGLKAEAEKPAEIVTTSPDGETKTSALPGANKEAEEHAEADVELHGKMEKYRKAYPNEKRFYITSDEQVFLSGNKIEALEHQRALDKSLAVVIYEA